MVLNDWIRGKIPFFTAPPFSQEDESIRAAKSKALGESNLEKQEAAALLEAAKSDKTPIVPTPVPQVQQLFSKIRVVTDFTDEDMKGNGEAEKLVAEDKGRKEIEDDVDEDEMPEEEDQEVEDDDEEEEEVEENPRPTKKAKRTQQAEESAPTSQKKRKLAEKETVTSKKRKVTKSSEQEKPDWNAVFESVAEEAKEQEEAIAQALKDAEEEEEVKPKKASKKIATAGKSSAQTAVSSRSKLPVFMVEDIEPSGPPSSELSFALISFVSLNQNSSLIGLFFQKPRLSKPWWFSPKPRFPGKPSPPKRKKRRRRRRARRHPA